MIILSVCPHFVCVKNFILFSMFISLVRTGSFRFRPFRTKSERILNIENGIMRQSESMQRTPGKRRGTKESK